MNEDLQKELIAILRELKDGASPAWQTLVEQRGGYYTASGFSELGLALAMILLIAITWIVGMRWIRYWGNKLGENAEFAHVASFIVPCIVTLVFGMGVCFKISDAVNDLVLGAYPLGQLLGKVIG